VYIVPVSASRLNITLPEAHAAKLARLAERTHVQEGTLARSLLAQAIDDADVDPRHIVDVLDGIPGAWDRIDAGLADAAAGRTIEFDEL
jgi:predicted transcriptional regulator